MITVVILIQILARSHGGGSKFICSFCDRERAFKTSFNKNYCVNFSGEQEQI